MTVPFPILAFETVFVAPLQIGGMKGVLIEFLLQPDARRLAGLSADIELPPMRFALHEGMARKLIEAIARRLEYPDENGETVH